MAGQGDHKPVEVNIYDNVPLREKPLGNVNSVPVCLAPAAQLLRKNVILSAEPQSADFHLELSGETWSAYEGLSPVGISTFAKSEPRVGPVSPWPTMIHLHASTSHWALRGLMDCVEPRARDRLLGPELPFRCSGGLSPRPDCTTSCRNSL